MATSGDALSMEILGPLFALSTTANLSPESPMTKFSGAILGGMMLFE
jgi:hypothetical protein